MVTSGAVFLEFGQLAVHEVGQGTYRFFPVHAYVFSTTPTDCLLLGFRVKEKLDTLSSVKDNSC